MAGNDNTGSADTQTADERKRFRSEIEFPYADLPSAVASRRPFIQRPVHRLWLMNWLFGWGEPLAVARFEHGWARPGCFG